MGNQTPGGVRTRRREGGVTPRDASVSHPQAGGFRHADRSASSEGARSTRRRAIRRYERPGRRSSVSRSRPDRTPWVAIAVTVGDPNATRSFQAGWVLVGTTE